MSNNSIKRKGVTPITTANTEEDYDFDIHFDKPIDPEHLEGADTDDFYIENTESEEEEKEEDVIDEEEDYDFDSQEVEKEEVDTEDEEEVVDEEAEDYDFDSENVEKEEVETEEEGFANDWNDNATLEEELRELSGMEGIKMQSTQSLLGAATQDVPPEEDYDFDIHFDQPIDPEHLEGAETEEEAYMENTESEEEEKEEDYDFDSQEVDAIEAETEEEEDVVDEEEEDYDFDSQDMEKEEADTIEAETEDEEFVEEEIPTSSKIAQMIHPKSTNKTLHKKPKIDTPIPKVRRTLGDYIDSHRTKIILIAILILISSLWGYASQVGITTKSIPTFQNDTIKILKTQGVQMQYTIREKLIFHQSQMQIELNDSTTMEINGTTALSSKMFSSIQHNLKNATFEILDSKIKITSTGEINILNAITELINNDFSHMLEGVIITNTNLIVENSEGKVINNIFIDKLEIKNTPQKSTITGRIITKSKPIIINYSYTKSSNLLNATIKSPFFNFNINGTKKTFGTASKDSQTKGQAELSIKDIEEFVQIFGGSTKITKHLTNLPQFTIQLDFEYSSLNHEFSISKGKINALNSIGLFTLKTTPDSYQAVVNFETISITEIISKITGNFKAKTQTGKVEKQKPDTKQTHKTKKEKNNNSQNNTNNSHILNIFSVINPAKPLEIKILSKNISAQNESFFQNLETNLKITKENIALQNLKIEAGTSLQIEANGSINNIQSNLASILNISISGSGNYKNIINKVVKLATDFEISKAITEETSVINLSIVHKAPATTIDTISIEIQDTLSLQGTTQFTEHFTEDTLPSVFRNITISNTNFNNLKIDGISTPQGMTIFQSVINENAQNTSNVLNIVNSQFKDTTITQGTLTKETQKDIISYNIDINTPDFNLTNFTTVNIQQSTPALQSNTVVQNVENLQKFYNTLRGIFNKDTISYPSFEKIDGKIDITLIKSQILSKPFERIDLVGTLTQGILNITETQFASSIVGTEKPLSGKISGTIDLRRSTPVFNLQTTFINAPMEEFKAILPFETNIGGSIYGGGSVSFSGTTYTNFLNTLKLSTKFVVQEANFSKFNLDLLAQNLLKTHKNLSALETDYIKIAFEQDSKTKANFIFSLNGEDKKFTIEDCTIKTAYSGGVCYGSVTIGEQNNTIIEIMAKFEIPALDIRNSLKGPPMKLQIASKIKQEGETCEITNDLSQVNKYTSYRRTTFSS